MKALVESPTAAEIFGNPDFLKLKTFYVEGPFYVVSEHAVALEGGNN